MSVATNPRQEQLDPAVRFDLLLVLVALRDQILGHAVKNVHILLGNVNVLEEMGVHKGVVGLRVVVREADILVHVERDNVLEGNTSLLVQLHEPGKWVGFINDKKKKKKGSEEKYDQNKKSEQ